MLIGLSSGYVLSPGFFQQYAVGINIFSEQDKRQKSNMEVLAPGFPRQESFQPSQLPSPCQTSLNVQSSVQSTQEVFGYAWTAECEAALRD